jgi:hypothetical protein
LRSASRSLGRASVDGELREISIAKDAISLQTNREIPQNAIAKR